jgi:hypothetical protein
MQFGLKRRVEIALRLQQSFIRRQPRFDPIAQRTMKRWRAVGVGIAIKLPCSKCFALQAIERGLLR